jgi:hypothetical protein
MEDPTCAAGRAASCVLCDDDPVANICIHAVFNFFFLTLETGKGMCMAPVLLYRSRMHGGRRQRQYRSRSPALNTQTRRQITPGPVVSACALGRGPV